MWEAKTILNPRSFTDASSEAYEIACDVARRNQAHLIFLHVAGAPVADYVRKVSDRPPGEIDDRLFDVMQAKKVAENDLDIEHRVVEGDAVREILTAARASNCDLIILGRNDATGLSRLFKRDVAAEIVRHAPCSVMVARHASPTVEPVLSESTL